MTAVFNKLQAAEKDSRKSGKEFIPLNTELNPICHFLALLEAHLIFHVSRIRVKKMKWKV